MGVTKGLVKAGRVIVALIIGGLAGYAWYFQSPTDPFYYPVGIALVVAGLAYLFFSEKSISGSVSNAIRTILFVIFGAFLGYMWYTQYKDIQQALIVGIVSVVLLVLLGRKAFTKGGEE
ncbi:MAG: hypothetical protein DRM99_05800 [Thermoplasmata archaeon]|nr:MAG: hypothetical protein DRM99_05800 [Thermoplasmata archaeon]